MPEQPFTVCPSCGRDNHEWEWNRLWIKAGVRIENVGGRAVLMRCGHCGWERDAPPEPVGSTVRWSGYGPRPTPKGENE